MENFRFKKSLGQNFLKDDNIVKKIVSSSGVDKDTLVIEIGPGAGSLSKEIIPLAGYTLMYEIDERLKVQLNTLLKDKGNYEIIFGDFLQQDVCMDIDKFKGRFKKLYVVANLPYYITTPIITKLINEVMPDRIVIMIQEEVADRLSAVVSTRNYGMISALIGCRYEVLKLFTVSRNCFIPAPNVDSAVICLNKKDMVESFDYCKYEKLLKNAFQFKRKNLKNNLRLYDLNLISSILMQHGYTLNNRAEDIPIDVWIDIVNHID